MLISSKNFSYGQSLPPKYTCDGENINPELNFEDVPLGAKSLAIILDDPDAPSGNFVHWIVWNIDPKKKGVMEGEKNFSTTGKNSAGTLSYFGPCPHSGEHRYFFRLYALDEELSLMPGASEEDLLQVMNEHTIDKTETMGRYSRKL